MAFGVYQVAAFIMKHIKFCFNHSTEFRENLPVICKDFNSHKTDNLKLCWLKKKKLGDIYKQNMKLD